MMNVSTAESDRLSIYDYEELLYHWNEAHSTNTDADAPDPEVAMQILDFIASDPQRLQ